MKPLSFKNRIAFLFLASTAMLVLFVYLVIYFSVTHSVYADIDNDISAEVKELLNEVKASDGTLTLIDADEWKEKEHITLNVNPIYIQILDSRKKSVEKSPNLKSESLKYDVGEEDFSYYNAQLLRQSVRQTQFPMIRNGRLHGYLIVAMSLEDANAVLKNLREILLISFPLVLLTLFVITRFIAGKSIKPISEITNTTSEITKENLGLRVKLPVNKDEIYILSTTINNLLDRIENAIVREKQFTSDASHELRTPLAVVKGTLEVLIRKPRDTQEYKEKINFCISEIDRLNALVDQLLLLARFENQDIVVKKEVVALNETIMESLQRFSSKIENRNIAVDFKFEKHFHIHSDAYLVSMIISNLVSNALKYSDKGGMIKIALTENQQSVECSIIDNGIGIPEADLPKIFGQFYRAQPSEHPEKQGTGLGLSLVKRLCDLLGTQINVESTENIGTTVTLRFNK